MNARVALSRVQLRDSFVMAETADIFVSNLTQFAQTNPDAAVRLEAAHVEAIEQAYGFHGQNDNDRKPFVFQDGFAVIPVHGALLNRFGGAYSFATGYNYIRRMLLAALEDDDVKIIVFDMDSPGGEAAGCFELAEEIKAASELKPLLVVVDSLCASAGYALASGATKIYATPSSKVGSIGVIRMHMNLKGMFDKMGVEVTIIEAPEEGMKSAGSPYRPLTMEEKADFQESVNKAYDDFVSIISANRGMDAEAVRGTKAKVFRADEALALTLIDAVKTPSEAVSSFMAELADECDDEDDIPQSEDEDMTTKTNSEVASAAGTPAAPTADQIAAAITADRERMTAIKALPEAASRPKLADTLAMGGYTVEQATALLGAAAEEAAAAPAPAPAPAPAAATTAAATPAVDTTNHLAAAMAGAGSPDVGAGTPAGGAAAGAEPTSEDLAAAILKDQGSVVGTNYGEAKK